MVRVPLATPGTTRVLAWVNFLGPGRADVYVPGQDAPPTLGWPTNLEEVAGEWAGKVTIGKLNVDENPGTATKFDILSIPTLLVFSKGEVVKKLVGAMPKKRLAEELAPWVG